MFHWQCFPSRMYFTVMLLYCFRNAFFSFSFGLHCILTILALDRLNMVLYTALFQINFLPASFAEEFPTRYTQVLTLKFINSLLWLNTSCSFTLVCTLTRAFTSWRIICGTRFLAKVEDCGHLSTFNSDCALFCVALISAFSGYFLGSVCSKLQLSTGQPLLDDNDWPQTSLLSWKSISLESMLSESEDMSISLATFIRRHSRAQNLTITTKFCTQINTTLNIK